MSFIANRRDIDFLLYENLNLNELLQSKRYQQYDRESISDIMELAQSIAEECFSPIAAKMDEEEPKFVNGQVTTVEEVKPALVQYYEAGMGLIGFDEGVGGMQLPLSVGQAVKAMFGSANGALNNYTFLTEGAANLLIHCGSEELKQTYLRNMIQGKWYGTMCLSETQAGSSLSDIATKAEFQADGSFNITGSKMWISGGDQDISENIVHMVLARIPGSPLGTKGISLFLVPKYRVNSDGSLGDFNNISLAGLNHKMGQRGTTNCLLNFGEQGNCIGYLLGKENQGLTNMFHMMNEARIAVGMGAVMYGVSGYLYSLDYAINRPQGRLLSDKNPAEPQVMICEHTDVKRMLMVQKVYVEGGLHLVLYSASLIDALAISMDEGEKQRIHLLLELLIPIVKSWPSEYCLEANKLAIQILGGYGYTRDYPVERLYRDNRLNHIHEGTWGIHGLDLLGRKVRMHDGAALVVFLDRVKLTLVEAQQYDQLSEYVDGLTQVLDALNECVKKVKLCHNFELSLANATPFLDAMGHIVIAWLWLKQALAALHGLKDGKEVDLTFYEGKLMACQFFYRYELPQVLVKLALVSRVDDTCYQLNTAHFIGD